MTAKHETEAVTRQRDKHERGLSKREGYARGRERLA